MFHQEALFVSVFGGHTVLLITWRLSGNKTEVSLNANIVSVRPSYVQLSPSSLSVRVRLKHVKQNLDLIINIIVI